VGGAASIENASSTLHCTAYSPTGVFTEVGGGARVTSRDVAVLLATVARGASPQDPLPTTAVLFEGCDSPLALVSPPKGSTEIRRDPTLKGSQLRTAAGWENASTTTKVVPLLVQ
jgi:hypothetical protein